MSHIFINAANVAHPISDMGLEIPANGQLAITDKVRLATSEDAVAALYDPDITYSDGSSVLTISDAIDHIRGYQAKQIELFGVKSSGGYRFRGYGIIGQKVLAATWQQNPQQVFDYTLPENRILDGVIVQITSGGGDLDFVEFSVVIPDGHPANPNPGKVGEFLADTFAPKWFVSGHSQHIQLYRATLYAGFKIRVKYNSSQSVQDTTFFVNAFLHQVPA